MLLPPLPLHGMQQQPVFAAAQGSSEKQQQKQRQDINTVTPNSEEPPMAFCARKAHDHRQQPQCNTRLQSSAELTQMACILKDTFNSSSCMTQYQLERLHFQNRYSPPCGCVCQRCCCCRRPPWALLHTSHGDLPP
jgi:hypothetical protein